MFEIEYERIDGETIRLTQGEYEGISLSVDLHPTQLRHIARELCGMNFPAGGDRATEAERKLAVLVDRLQDIVCDTWNRRVLSSGEDEFRVLERLDALLELGIEMDGGRLEPAYRDGHEAASEIEHPRRPVKTSDPKTPVKAAPDSVAQPSLLS